MPGVKNTQLAAFVEQELFKSVPSEVGAMVEAIRQHRLGGVSAIVFYGSCLRDGKYVDGLLDFYVIVDDFRDVYESPWSRIGNWLVPPNVYYLETELDGQRLCAKYAVLSRRQFAQQTSIMARHVSLWARLCQPCRCVYVKDLEWKRLIVSGVSSAIETFYRACRPLLPKQFSSDQMWATGLAQCYRTEFRAEGANRGAEVLAQDQHRYAQLTSLLVQQDSQVVEESQGQFRLSGADRVNAVSQWQWFKWRVAGRVLQVFRLAKAAFTFADGLTYILYKIEKHSGQSVPTTEWQKRHPLLAAPGLAWQLYRKGGFR